MPAATSIEADLVTHNKSIGAPLHCNRSYGYGLRCGVSIADDTDSSPLFRTNKSHSKFSNTKGFVGGVPVNTETSASEILRVRSRHSGGVAAVFVLYCREWRRVLNQCSAPLHSRSSFKSRMPECQSGDAGAIPADRTIFLETHNVCGGRQLAQQLCLRGSASIHRGALTA